MDKAVGCSQVVTDNIPGITRLKVKSVENGIHLLSVTNTFIPTFIFQNQYFQRFEEALSESCAHSLMKVRVFWDYVAADKSVEQIRPFGVQFVDSLHCSIDGIHHDEDAPCHHVLVSLYENNKIVSCCPIERIHSELNVFYILLDIVSVDAACVISNRYESLHLLSSHPSARFVAKLKIMAKGYGLITRKNLALCQQKVKGYQKKNHSRLAHNIILMNPIDTKMKTQSYPNKIQKLK